MRRAAAALAILLAVAGGGAAGVAGARYAISHRLESASEKLDGWTVNFNYGRYGSDLLLRAAMSQFGMGANQAEESV